MARREETFPRQKRPGTLPAQARYLHQRTGGIIGSPYPEWQVRGGFATVAAVLAWLATTRLLHGPLITCLAGAVA
jgi:hypothetical protein